ncbi:MAG: hypothetical protein QXW41_07870 [Fervidicoccaceae archaeon]|uniref:hypothetical protein n=1 Tax=Pyrobaculum sp. TaxID=2004705 RepID=UPI0031642F16
MERLAEKFDVVVLITPGSSRLKIAEKAVQRGLNAVAYKTGGPWREIRQSFVEEAAALVARGGRWVVVPPDTTTAKILYQKLKEKKIKAEILYLPELYKKELKADKEVLEVAKISHEIGGERREGISLKLMQYAEEGREEVERAVKAIRALSPGVVGFGDVLKKAADAAAETLKTAPISALAGALDALVIAPVFVGIAASLGAVVAGASRGAA